MIKEIFTINGAKKERGQTIFISIDKEEQKASFYHILESEYGFHYIKDSETYAPRFYANYDLVVFAYDEYGSYAYIGDIGDVLNDVPIAYITDKTYGVVANGLCELLSIIAYYPNWRDQLCNGASSPLKENPRLIAAVQEWHKNSCLSGQESAAYSQDLIEKKIIQYDLKAMDKIKENILNNRDLCVWNRFTDEPLKHFRIRKRQNLTLDESTSLC